MRGMDCEHPRPEARDCLAPTYFLDSDSPSVIEYAASAIGRTVSDVERGVALYYAIRDQVRYNPYALGLDRAAYRASSVLKAREGFCVQKAILLAAAARAVGIPSRLGFADVRNHLSTERLRRTLSTDVFAFHGYTELFLEGRWVKATPAFNRTLCERFNTAPLEFDGRHDSIFQPLDLSGNRYMEYLRFRGEFADFPFDMMVKAFREVYPHFFGPGVEMPQGDFYREE
jgi:transglutaminase-like putative cysteine protease